MNNNYLIAVVDDDQHIRNLVEAYLQKENYRTVGLGSAEEAWTLWQTSPPDMWVLDVMLPGMDGYEFCRRIRNEAEVPIIMISARDNEVDKILGLELGSDDYLVKPFRADPLEMAKTYAPNTLEDWKKTLEQYNKLTGLTLSVAVDSVSIKQGKVVELAKEILSEESMSVGYIEAGPTLDLSVLETMVIEGKLGEGTNVSLIEAVEASPVTISSIEFSEADEAFYKAQDALGEAAKSKDAAAIKGALADLLVQYKEKIKELETAK